MHKMQALFLLFFNFPVFFPEKIVERQTQHPADTDTELDGGVIVPFFDGIDGLA